MIARVGLSTSLAAASLLAGSLARASEQVQDVEDRPREDAEPFKGASLPVNVTPADHANVVERHEAQATIYGECPTRLSVQKDSPFFDADAITHIRVWFRGTERNNVVEYDVKNGWYLLQLRDVHGRPRWSRGKHVTTKIQGAVVVRWK